MCIQKKFKSNIKTKMTGFLSNNLQDSHIIGDGVATNTLKRNKCTG